MDTKEKLIEAADRCLLENGCHASCVKAIAEEAGVNHGLIHHYFGSKEDLFIELLRKYFMTIKPPADLSLNSEEEVVAFFKKNIIPSSRIMVEFRGLAFQMPRLRAELISMAAEVRTSLKELLDIQEEESCIIMSSVLGFGFHSFLEPDLDIEKHLQIIFNLILKKDNHGTGENNG